MASKEWSEACSVKLIRNFCKAQNKKSNKKWPTLVRILPVAPFYRQEESA